MVPSTGDVGSKQDLEPAQPAGCKGKIDFLFVISGQTAMSDIQAQLVDAFPKFIDTSQAKFADVDYHIMVVDGDPFWGHLGCNEDCAETCKAVGYPCDAIDTITACDQTWGGGVVFNAGSLAVNKRCEIPDGRRYLIKGDPALKETFACMAQVGESGYDALGAAFAAAMSPELNGPGGCNEGFLRDDALLFVTFVSVTPDDDSSPGTPQDWAAAEAEVLRAVELVEEVSEEIAARQAQSVARVEAVEHEVLVLEEAVRVARAAREKATGDG